MNQPTVPTHQELITEMEGFTSYQHPKDLFHFEDVFPQES